MEQLRRVIRRSAWRVGFGRFFRALLVTLAGVIGALALALLAQRLFGVAIDWAVVSAAACGAAVVGAAAWAWAKRPSPLAIARAVDERAGLREAISTALCVDGREDAWSRATVEHAARAAAGVDPGRLFPARTPSVWPAPMVAAAVLALMWLAVPQFDVLGLLKKEKATEAERQAVTQAVAEVKSHEDEIKDALKKLDDPTLLDDAATGDKPEPKTAAEVRQEAIRRLTTLQERLEDLRQGDKGLKLDALQDKLNQLRQPGPGPLNEASQALAKGDFKKAKEELEKLAEKLASGAMSPADKEALQKQLEDLAKQLEKLAEQRKDMEQKLQEMGLDPALAGDPNALEKALDKMAGLSDQQKQQLMQAARAAEGACKAAQGMAGALAKAGQQMQGGMAGEAMQGAADQLGDMEMLAQEMQAAEAAQAALNKGLKSLGQCNGDGMGKAEFDMWQLWTKQGRARGEGDGSPRDSQQAAFQTKIEKDAGKTQAGPIIGTRLVEGEQVRGESTAQFAQVVEAGSQAAAEAIDHNAIPREDQDAVKRYFGRLHKKVKAEQPAPAPAESGAGANGSTAPAKPASGGGSGGGDKKPGG